MNKKIKEWHILLQYMSFFLGSFLMVYLVVRFLLGDFELILQYSTVIWIAMLWILSR